jgi:hypothetical protein
MNPGDLRRFNVPMRFSHDARRVDGRVFVVVDVYEHDHHVDMLVDGSIEQGWDYHWVRENSEPVNEAR